jgi:hypothetical protein
MPSSEDLDSSAVVPIRNLQIIVAAVAAGPLPYLLFVIFAQEPPQAQPPAMGARWNMTMMSLAFALSALIARALVPAAIVDRARRAIAMKHDRSDDGATAAGGVEPQLALAGLWSAYSTKTIVAVALLESACLFLIVTYSIERQPVALAAAIAFVVGIVCHFPTTVRAGQWLEDQLQRLEQEQWL